MQSKAPGEEFGCNSFVDSFCNAQYQHYKSDTSGSGSCLIEWLGRV